MRCLPRERGRWHEPRRIPCGQWVHMFGEVFSYPRQQRCHCWSCDDCRAEKIRDIQFEMGASGLPLVAYVIFKPAALTPKETRSMSNFLNQKVTGKYWCIRSDVRQIVISNRQFDGAIRLRTVSIIYEKVPDILNEPWSFEYRKRITRPQGQEIPLRPRYPGYSPSIADNDPNPLLFQWIGPNGQQASRKFYGFKFAFEKGSFLRDNLENVILKPLGEKLIKFMDTPCGG